MQKEIAYGASTIHYALRRSTRARRMRLVVHRDGSVVLTTPARVATDAGDAFVQRHARWLAEKIAFFRGLPPLDPVASYGRREYLGYREQARALVLSKLDGFAALLGGTSYGLVRIKDQKTCWGSCSRKGNLNFNYKILFLPPHLQDYVIVHELAHVRELSHSRRFWALVATVIPDCLALRKELRARRML
jgi:predicted metal-dependent hydrolase